MISWLKRAGGEVRAVRERGKGLTSVVRAGVLVGVGFVVLLLFCLILFEFVLFKEDS